MNTRLRPSSVLLAATLLCQGSVFAHETTLPHHHHRAAASRQRQVVLVNHLRQQTEERGICRLTLELREADTGKAVAGLVRIVSRDSGKPIALPSLIARPRDWYAMDGKAVVSVPRGKLRIEAIRGIDTLQTSANVDFDGRESARQRLTLTRFYRPEAGGLRGGNTHLHLRRLSRAAADRYLQVVGRADALDLVYVSHLRRAEDERTYISNEYTPRDLAKLSLPDLTLRHGEEHRHNFGPSKEGYGHVMLLDIKQLIRPVSIGPGIMRTGTDGRPLETGIRAARRDQATVVWCHNTFGLEDLPNWILGNVHAQNIHDGGSHGGYEDTFYKYLNIGLKVPFSTGTDWFVYDFSRVYVPVEGRGATDSRRWLAGLTAGRSYITNGAFLEFQVDGRPIGATIAVNGETHLPARGRALGRADFGTLELVHNGRVVHRVEARRTDRGYFEARLDRRLTVAKPGWVALRINPGNRKNTFGEDLFAHTSPVYFEQDGRRRFQPEIAQQLLSEMQRSIPLIKNKGVFANDQERESVVDVYRRAIKKLTGKRR